jgi:hypothetical protein
VVDAAECLRPSLLYIYVVFKTENLHLLFENTFNDARGVSLLNQWLLYYKLTDNSTPFEKALGLDV